MKKLTLLTSFILLFGVVYATIYTVDNNLNSGAMFTSLPAAIDSADSGDTILVSGSGTNYWDIEINKKLILVGAGYNPNNQTGLGSQLNIVRLDSLNGVSSARGTIITGFDIGLIIGGDYRLTTDIIIERNRIGSIGLQNVDGWIIRHNIISTLSHSENKVSNLMVINNIFRNNSNLIGWNDNTSVSIVFANNIFTANGATIYSNAANNIFFNNNIFYGVTPYNVNNENCSWSNNIVYSTPNDTINVSGSNSGNGNMYDVDPQFEDVASVVFDYDYDYHLQGGSPGENAGTDGSDIGIYGTSYPFPGETETPYQTSPMPKIPQIIEMCVKNPTIPLDGTLQIQINARKND